MDGARLLDVLRAVNETKSWLGAMAGAAAFWFLILPQCEVKYTISGQVQDCHSAVNLGIQWSPQSTFLGLIVAIVLGALIWIAGHSIYESVRAAK
jgi:hypothetical protein